MTLDIHVNEKKTLKQKICEVRCSIVKDAQMYVSGRTNIKYASYNAIMGVLEPILNRSKIGILHAVENNELITEVYDFESKESFKSTLKLPNISINNSKEATDAMKVYGMGLTYYKRYNVSIIFNIQSSDDLDSYNPNQNNGNGSYPNAGNGSYDNNIKFNNTYKRK